MGDVVDLGNYRPHLTGEAFCTGCGHHWVAVAEVGTKVLGCPQCQRNFGLFRGPVEPREKWKCNCGEMLFWLTEKGPMCRGCGLIPKEWAD